MRHLDDGSVNFIEGTFFPLELHEIYVKPFFLFHFRYTVIWLELIFLYASPGARQPTYLVTADDVDSVLAIEVQPLDDRKRKVYFHIMCGSFLYGIVCFVYFRGKLSAFIYLLDIK